MRYVAMLRKCGAAKYLRGRFAVRDVSIVGNKRLVVCIFGHAHIHTSIHSNPEYRADPFVDHTKNSPHFS